MKDPSAPEILQGVVRSSDHVRRDDLAPDTVLTPASLQLMHTWSVIPMGKVSRMKRIGASLQTASASVSSAIRKLATAASSHLGTDCLLHAELGRALLNDLGIKARSVVGCVSWRAGAGQDDVIGRYS